MPSQVLLVDDAPDVRESLARVLRMRHLCSTAANAEEALDLWRRRGPYAVVVAEHAIPEFTGLELLQRLHAEEPHTVGILLGRRGDADLSLAAANDPAVFRLLPKPCDVDTLQQALAAGLERHAASQTSQLTTERLEFSVETLESFTRGLESRLVRQESALRSMNRLAIELAGASGFAAIARLVADAIHDVLARRGVHVQLWDPAEPAALGEAGAGPEMSVRMHREPIQCGALQVGELVVDVHCPAGRALDRSDLALASSIAATCAVAARDELRRRDRDRAQHAAILALARLAEQRSHGGARHFERIAAYLGLLADGLRREERHAATVDDAWIDDLVRASPLYDIGKLGIPDSILLKPGQLSPAEWEIMKTHTELGALTLDGVLREVHDAAFLRLARDLAHAHHEKWDGSGYPRGLAGDAIPLAARLLALADVYDALTCDRPYRSAWTHEAARAWIEGASGAHFDPDVAAVFLAREAEFDSLRARLADARPAHATPA